jgi:hypothetical protein
MNATIKPVKKERKTKPKLHIVEDEVEVEDKDNAINFVKQVYRKDILTNMLKNIDLTGKEILKKILTDNNTSTNESRQGWIYETCWQIVIILKCVNGINYNQILDGKLDNLKLLKNINYLLKIKIAGGGDNITDFTIQDKDTIIPFSIKYKSGFKETDVSKIDNTIKTQQKIIDSKIGLIVKNKEIVKNHKYKNSTNIDKIIHDSIIANGLLFDETDLINALDVFRKGVPANILEIEDYIEYINTEFLLSSRKQLVLKLHQKMAEIKFINSFLKNKHKMWCISHKPRSGKSITILTICKYLLKNGINKILIMTSVPGTISNFVDDLENYVDFKNINYTRQEDFDKIDELFNGIVFCSVQFLKMDGGKNSKKDQLKKIGFDLIITDECHLGGSTDKTRTEILDIDGDIEDIRKNIKLTIFASGTAGKTIKYYGIKPSQVFEWELIDEGHMKESLKLNAYNDNVIEFMVKRHGPVFMECLEDETLNKDYSKHPTQILMKHNIDDKLILKIKEYNLKYGTNFGYSCTSLFALSKSRKSEPEKDKNGQTVKTKDGNDYYEYEYNEEFELAKTEDGLEILNWFFDCIISDNKMKGKDKPEHKTIMTKIEETQTVKKSRKSSKQNPLLFIMYLPTHTGNNTIAALQRTFKNYLETNNLWSEYNIEYSNSNEDSGNIKEEYNESITTMMNRTKTNNKRGCILLLGNKGSVGITYNDCDVTISLDDGHNLDNQQQRFSRALTEANGKTIGINVDMNIQRTYLYLLDIIHKHRKTTNTKQTNAEILYYLYEHNIFLFNPQQFNNGKCTIVEIMKYYEDESGNIMKEIDDSQILENIVCEDEMRDFIKTNFKTTTGFKQMNEDLEGEQQDCSKGDKTKTQIDAPNGEAPLVPDITPEESEKIDLMINQTLEMCKSFLFPLLALISRSYNIHDFKAIFTNEKTFKLIVSLLKDKKIDLNKDNYSILINIMNNIIDNNEEIVNNIREIYSVAPANKLRELIEKHFVPTNDEKKENAEVPTPVKLVDEMLKIIPNEFWKTPKKVFEPCCGKGNFVLGIFDNFYKGLEDLYPDEIDRCRVIMTECIYYADLTALNVFITTEIMKCHVQSRCGLEELEYEFNFHIGDTLELNINTQWHIEGFDAVIGNPPYNNPTGTGGSRKLWDKFVILSIDKLCLTNGYIVLIHPPNWRKPESKLLPKIKSLNLIKLHILNEEEGKKYFHCATKVDYYLLQKSKYSGVTLINDTLELDISQMPFIPNTDFDTFKNIAGTTTVLCPNTSYASDMKWMADDDTLAYKYILTANSDDIKYKYSNLNKNYATDKKIILSSGRYPYPIDDFEGKYGLSCYNFGIQIESKEEGDNIIKCIKSDKFQKLLKENKWGSYNIEWRMFKYFKKDFWKEFV